jgi:hypothetical protein
MVRHIRADIPIRLALVIEDIVRTTLTLSHESDDLVHDNVNAANSV